MHCGKSWESSLGWHSLFYLASLSIFMCKLYGTEKVCKAIKQSERLVKNIYWAWVCLYESSSFKHNEKKNNLTFQMSEFLWKMKDESESLATKRSTQPVSNVQKTQNCKRVYRIRDIYLVSDKTGILVHSKWHFKHVNLHPIYYTRTRQKKKKKKKKFYGLMDLPNRVGHQDLPSRVGRSGLFFY